MVAQPASSVQPGRPERKRARAYNGPERLTGVSPAPALPPIAKGIRHDRHT